MSAYLAMLDLLLEEGAALLPPAFVERQVRFVEARQCTDGGFPGRQSDADLYYTDFALRVLTLCAPHSAALPRAAHYLAQCPPPTDHISAFCLLNGARMLERRGITVPQPAFTPNLGCPTSAYQIFLNALCREMRGEPQMVNEAALQALRGADGGYGDRPGEVRGQTNATAAALGTLVLWERVAAIDLPAVTAFLTGMQAADGGLCAHGLIAAGDLLSTFTGVLTLVNLGGIEGLRLAEIGRFTQRLACAGGGFRGALADAEPDVEYTFYGLGTLALLAQCLR
jgi:geranylgeranyl transferase type-2 subunit beta